MLTDSSYSRITHPAYAKLQDYAQLVKLRLSIVVVFSAAMGYLLASSGHVIWTDLFLLVIGGFLVTGASNSLNQILERDIDKLMKRTAGRPLAAERMSITEAIIASGLMALSGVLILWLNFNMLSALLGSLSLFMYVFLYTPMKRLTPLAVFVGAIPGALPPMIGWVALTGEIGVEALLIFSIQFIWQLPHFWAIAWVLDDDYKRAGFRLLPSKVGRDKHTATQILVYCLILIPISLIPAKFGMTGLNSAIFIFLCGFGFLFQAIELYIKCDQKSAYRLMLASFLYLPLVLLALVIDKL